jgi:pimeloyl-ACP methyl ester carboxylesterase
VAENCPEIFTRSNAVKNPEILFLHGFPESSRKWAKFLEKCGKEGIGAVAMDLPGFGQSDLLHGADYNVQAIAELVISKWRKLSSNPIYLVGHDWGGIVGWYIAAKLGHTMRGFTAIAAPYPKIFANLIERDSAQKLASKYINIFCSSTGADFCTKRNFERMKFALTDPQNGISDDELEELAVGWSNPARLDAMLQYYTTFFGSIKHWADELLPISAPVQVIWAANDHALVPANILGLGDHLSKLTVEILPDASHWVDRSHFEEVSALIHSHFFEVRGLDAHAIS